MFVAVGQLSFHLSGVSSLKGKRSIVRKMVERTKARFSVAIAEVGENDSHRRATIGVSVVGNSAAHVDAMLAKVCSFICRMELGETISHRTEVIAMGDHFGEDGLFSAFNGRYSEFEQDNGMDFEDFDE